MGRSQGTRGRQREGDAGRRHAAWSAVDVGGRDPVCGAEDEGRAGWEGMITRRAIQLYVTQRSREGDATGGNLKGKKAEEVFAVNKLSFHESCGEEKLQDRRRYKTERTFSSTNGAGKPGQHLQEREPRLLPYPPHK